MANKKNSTSAKNNSTKKPAPIKVEKIVDTPNNSTKEVFAIIVGILIVAALVVGSVIYFKGKDEEPLTKNKDKNKDTVDVLIEPEEEFTEETKKETEVKKLSAQNTTQQETVVKKECKSCSVIVLETYEPTKVNSQAEDKKYHKKNTLEVVETYYYTNDEDTYIVEVKGTIKATADDLELTERVNDIEDAKSYVEENKVTEEELNSVGFAEIKEILDNATEEGVITVKSEDTEVVTHTFVVRIEEKDKVDWEKGVTVNGTTYDESVLNKDEQNDYTYQDEDGINITVGVNKEDLGEDSENENIKFDVKYTTKENEVKENTYELDLKDVEIEYEEETDSAEDPQNPDATLGTEAITEEDIQEFVDDQEKENSDLVDELDETLEQLRDNQ